MKNQELIYVSTETFQKIYNYLASELLYANVQKRASKFETLEDFGNTYCKLCEDAHAKAENALVRENIDYDFLTDVSESHYSYTPKAVRKVIKRLRISEDV